VRRRITARNGACMKRTVKRRKAPQHALCSVFLGGGGGGRAAALSDKQATSCMTYHQRVCWQKRTTRAAAALAPAVNRRCGTLVCSRVAYLARWPLRASLSACHPRQQAATRRVAQRALAAARGSMNISPPAAAPAPTLIASLRGIMRAAAGTRLSRVSQQTHQRENGRLSSA